MTVQERLWDERGMPAVPLCPPAFVPQPILHHLRYRAIHRPDPSGVPDPGMGLISPPERVWMTLPYARHTRHSELAR